MDRRERFLLLALVVLLLAAGFYYRGTIGSYLPAITGGTGGGEEPRPEVDADRLLTQGLDRYRGALTRTLGIESLDLERLDGASGLAGTVQFELSLEGDTPAPRSALRGEFKGRILSDGLPRGTVRVGSPSEYPYDTWTLRVRDRDLFLGVGEAIRMRFDRIGLPSGAPFSPGLSEFTGRSVLDRTERRWQDRPVHALEIEADTGSKFLYVSRDEPHRLLGVAAGYDPGWTRHIEYDSDAIASINTYRDDELVRTLERTDNGSYHLTLRTGGGDDSNAVRLDVTPSGEQLDVNLSVRTTEGGSFSEWGGGSLLFENGRPASLEGMLRWGSSEGGVPGLRLGLNAGDLELSDRRSSTVEDSASYEPGTVPRLLGRVLSPADTVPVQPEETDAEAGAPSSTTGSPDTAVDRSKPSDRADEPESETRNGEQADDADRRTTETPEPKTKVTYPENSGETVVTWVQKGFSRSEPPPAFHGAQRLHRQGRYDRARERLEDLAETYPRSINVHYTLAVIHYDTGRAAEARKHFRRVLALGHDSQLVGWSRAYLKQLDSS